MMLFGLIFAVIGFVVAIAYSGIVGSVILVVGVGLVIKGYEPPEDDKFNSSRQDTGGGSMTYEISSKKRR